MQELHQLQEALKASPDNTALRKILCKTLVKQGMYDDAETEIRTALEKISDDAELQTLLSQVFYSQGRFDEALVILETILKTKNIPAESYIQYAKLLLKFDNFDKAKESYEKGRSLNEELRDYAVEEELYKSKPDFAYNTLGGDEADKGLKASEIDSEKPQITFKDVGGMESVKKQISTKILQPLKNPELYKSYGKKIGGGILLYGPPGCGKTHIARALAGEIEGTFFPTELHDILNMYVGESEKSLHGIFENARSHNPSVLFFDEVDALAGKRSDFHSGTMRQMVNQFLSELDGLGSSNEGVLILGATNAPWYIDSAFRRPGRFDRIIFVPPPDEKARTEILRILLQGKPLDTIDYEKIGSLTKDFSGADLKLLVDVVLEQKLEKAMETGKQENITTHDLKSALKEVKPSTKEWFSTAKNYAVYSNQGGIYDDILDYMNLR